MLYMREYLLPRELVSVVCNLPRVLLLVESVSYIKTYVIFHISLKNILQYNNNELVMFP